MISCLCILVRSDERVDLTHLSILSSGLPFLRCLKALVRWSFNMTASWRSLPMSRFFSLTSISKGKALSSSFWANSKAAVDSVDLDWASCSCFRSSSTCACEFSTISLNSLLRAKRLVSDMASWIRTKDGLTFLYLLERPLEPIDRQRLTITIGGRLFVCFPVTRDLFL